MKRELRPTVVVYLAILLAALAAFSFISFRPAVGAELHSADTGYELLDEFLSEITDYTADSGYTAIISDEAGLLSDDEKQSLLEDMKKILPYGGAAFVTTDYNPYTASRYAENEYSTLFGRDSATLFLIDMDNREIYIHSNGAIYNTVSKTRANEIADNVYTYASRGEYYECAKNAFSQISTILEGGTLTTPMKYATNAAFAVGIALFINFIIIYRQRRKPKEVSYLTMAAVKEYAEGNESIVKNISANMTKQTKSRHVESSGGGGGFSGGGGGGGFSGGGGGGGGGGHSF